MAKKGMEGVAINEITEAADVGFGSFYNHFESKEAIYAAVMGWVFEDFADALDRLVQDLTDPAEVVSVCVRHTLLRAQSDPVWGQFLIREGYSVRSLERGLGQRLLRDIRKGLESGRFKGEDPLMSFLSVGGTVLASISAWLQLHPTHGAHEGTLGTLGFSTDDLPQRVAKSLLLSLGLRRSEAEKIAYRPLPAGGALPEVLPGSSALLALRRRWGVGPGARAVQTDMHARLATAGDVIAWQLSALRSQQPVAQLRLRDPSRTCSVCLSVSTRTPPRRHAWARAGPTPCWPCWSCSRRWPAAGMPPASGASRSSSNRPTSWLCQSCAARTPWPRRPRQPPTACWPRAARSTGARPQTSR